jgi:hypothetical protein
VLTWVTLPTSLLWIYVDEYATILQVTVPHLHNCPTIFMHLDCITQFLLQNSKYTGTSDVNQRKTHAHNTECILF